MKKCFYFSLMVLMWMVVSHAQWQPDFRLTNNDVVSEYPSISVSDTVLHVAWNDNRDGNLEIYYKRSTDGGVSWSGDTRLTFDPFSSTYPRIASSGYDVHIVWSDDRDGNPEIYYKQSTDGGINWTPDIRLTNNNAISEYPSISVSGSIVQLVWQDNRNETWNIYYKRSNDGGTSWLGDIRLTTDAANSTYPSIIVQGMAVHVVWQDDRNGNWEIYYKHSMDGGLNWIPLRRLTFDRSLSAFPSIAVSDTIVHVIWYDDRDRNYEIYYKRSNDGGVNWSGDTRLTTDTLSSEFPSLVSSGTKVHVAWSDYSEGNWEIYYKRSTDGGVNWTPGTRLTNNAAASLSPSITVFGTVVHVVWYDNRDGNYEIYYKQNPTGNIVSVENINSGIPKDFKLYQNYPNPFNPSTRISWQLPVGSWQTLKVYGLLGREVATLVDEYKPAGKYETEFDASRLPSGVYFYQLRAGDFVETKKMILIK